MPRLSHLQRSSTSVFLQNLISETVRILNEYIGFWNSVEGKNPSAEEVTELLWLIQTGEEEHLSVILESLQQLVDKAPDRHDDLWRCIYDIQLYRRHQFSQNRRLLYDFFYDCSSQSKKEFASLSSFLFDTINSLPPEEKVSLFKEQRGYSILFVAMSHCEAPEFNKFLDLIENTAIALTSQPLESAALITFLLMPLTDASAETLIMRAIESNPAMLPRLLSLFRFMSPEDKVAVLTKKRKLNAHATIPASALDMAMSKDKVTLDLIIGAIKELPEKAKNPMIRDAVINPGYLVNPTSIISYQADYSTQHMDTAFNNLLKLWPYLSESEEVITWILNYHFYEDHTNLFIRMVMKLKNNLQPLLEKIMTFDAKFLSMILLGDNDACPLAEALPITDYYSLKEVKKLPANGVGFVRETELSNNIKNSVALIIQLIKAQGKIKLDVRQDIITNKLCGMDLVVLFELMKEHKDLKATMLKELTDFDNSSIFKLLDTNIFCKDNLWMKLLAEKDEDILPFFSKRMSLLTTEEHMKLYEVQATDGWDALMLEMKFCPVTLADKPGFGLPLLSSSSQDKAVDILTRTTMLNQDGRGWNALTLSLRHNTIDAVTQLVGLLKTNVSLVNVFKLMSLQNEVGDNALMLAIKHCPKAVELLLPFLNDLDQASLDQIFTQTNSKKMNVSMLMSKYLPYQYELLSPLLNRLSQEAREKIKTQIQACSKPLVRFFLEQKQSVDEPSQQVVISQTP